MVISPFLGFYAAVLMYIFTVACTLSQSKANDLINRHPGYIGRALVFMGLWA